MTTTEVCGCSLSPVLCSFIVSLLLLIIIIIIIIILMVDVVDDLFLVRQQQQLQPLLVNMISSSYSIYCLFIRFGTVSQYYCHCTKTFLCINARAESNQVEKSVRLFLCVSTTYGSSMVVVSFFLTSLTTTIVCLIDRWVDWCAYSEYSRYSLTHRKKKWHDCWTSHTSIMMRIGKRKMYMQVTTLLFLFLLVLYHLLHLMPSHRRNCYSNHPTYRYNVLYGGSRRIYDSRRKRNENEKNGFYVISTGSLVHQSSAKLIQSSAILIQSSAIIG